MDSGNNSCLPGAHTSPPFGSNYIPNPGSRWSPTYIFSKILVIGHKYEHFLLPDLQVFPVFWQTVRQNYLQDKLLHKYTDMCIRSIPWCWIHWVRRHKPLQLRCHCQTALWRICINRNPKQQCIKVSVSPYLCQENVLINFWLWLYWWEMSPHHSFKYGFQPSQDS